MDVSSFLKFDDVVTVQGVALATPSPGVSFPVDHLSATSLAMFQRCPEQFRRRYIRGEKERPGAALVLGSAFHFAQERNFSQKITSHEDLSVPEVLEAYHAGFDAAIEKNGGVNEIAWDEREKPDTLRAKGKIVTESYREQVAPSLQPLEVEERFSIELEGVPVRIVGAIDFYGHRIQGLNDPDPSDEGSHELLYGEKVIDYKTSGKKVSSLKPEWLLQARDYQFVKKAPVEYHVAVKTKEPQIITPQTEQALRIEVSDSALDTTALLLRRISETIAAYNATFGPDQYWPGAITHPWACGYCGYRPSCRWWVQ